MPTWATAAVSDNHWNETSGDCWHTGKALAQLDLPWHGEIAQAARVAEARCQPMDGTKRARRLTALGMVMAPNRSAADGAIWVRETSRLLGDIAEDVLCDAIDQWQRTSKFLPTVAEIRELAEPVMDRRRRDFSRLDAMRRFLESGQPIPQLLPPQKAHIADRNRREFGADDWRELNDYLERAGASSRFTEDGERYLVKEPPKPEHRELRKPTRADYIALGVDPAVLDRMEAERASAHGS